MNLSFNTPKIFGLLTAIIFLVFSTLITSAQVVGSDYYENVIRVKLEDSASQRVSVSSENGVALSGITSVDRLNRQFNAVTMKRVFSDGGKFKARREAFGLFRWYEIRFQGKTQVAELVSAYASDSNVEIAEPIYKKSFNQEGGKDLNFTPNDPQYPDQYNWNNTGQTGGTPGADVSAPEAWNIQSGDPSVIVSSHDSGIDTDHPDLSGVLWTNPNPDPVMNDLHGYNFANGNSNIYDSDGHGSHTSGTVAATNNNGIGVSGLAGGDGSGNGVRIMVCKVFGDGGVTGGFAESYTYAADHGAVISTNSWGYTSPGAYEQAVLDGIDYFIANAGYDENGNPVGPIYGGIVVFAAGNDGTDDEWYPAYYEPVYAVAGTNHFDRLIVNGVDGSWFGSNYGDWVDISAPGMFIISSVIDGYDTYSGTSMACPHVAGAAGLVASQYPGLTNDEVMLRVLGTADPIDDLNPGYEGKLGSGRLNAYAALIEDDGQPPEAITDLSITAMGQTTAGLQWTVPPASTPAGEGMNEAPALYDIRYSESPITNDTDFENATQVENPPIPLAPGETQSYTVTGLIPLTTYYFAIKSQDLFANKSEMSNVVSGTTEGAPILSTDPDELAAEVEVNTQLDQILTLGNIGEGTLTWSIPAYEALSILNNPNIPKNTVSRFENLELAKGETDPRQGDPVILGAGGPDDYGYTWIDSDEPGGPVFNWYEISEIGTELTDLAGQWDGYTQVTLPFNFKIYDEEWNTAYIGGNGWIYFGDSPSGWYTNQSIPTADDPNNLLAVFWDDLDMRETGAVYIYHDEDQNLFIVQWDAIPKSFDTGSLLTFQAILSPHGGVVYQYLDMTGTLNSSTVGIENADGTDGLQVVFNSTYVHNQLAVKINTPRIEWLDVTPISGSLEPGETVDLTATFDATGLLAGLDYTGDLSISSNDPSKPTHPVPVTMTVTGGNPEIAVSDDTVDFGTIIQGTSTSLPFMIYNVGSGAALTVSDIQIDDPAFTVNETTLSIMPGDSAEVTLTFTAADAATYNGTMTIVSNDATDPNYQVALTGIGGAAPIVGTDPAEFVKTQEAGTVTTETLTIQNNGGSDLLFSLNIETTGSSLEYSIPASDGNFHRSNSQKSIGPAPRNGNPIEEVAGSTVELNQLEEATYYGVNYGNTTDFVSFQGNVPEELNIIGPYGGANFSNAGDYPLGEDSFVYELDNAGDLRTIDVATGEATLLGNIGAIGDGWTGMATDPTDGTIYISTGTSLATLDVDGLSYSTIGSWSVSYMIGIAIDNEGVMYGYDLETAMLYSINKETADITAIGSIGFDPNYGQGLTYDTQHDLLVMAAFNNTTFAAELRLVDPTTGNTELIGVLGETIPGGTNQLGWIAAPISATPDWLVANPVEGTVAPGGTFDVELTFDATELIGNVDYYANVNVESNDPVTPVHVVPVTLSTTGTPQIAVDPTSLDFGDVFLGTSKDLTFTVTNNGNAVLNVSGISIGNEAYSTDADAFILLPGNSKVVTVTFAPSSLGDYGSTLTIANDDVDVDVALTASCVPFLTTSVDEFNETLEAGQTVTRTFTITNEYDDNLPFSIYIKGVDASVEPTFYPSNLSDVELLKWFDMAKNPKPDNPNKIVSAGIDPESLSDGTKTGSTGFPLQRLLSETNVTAYSMDVWDDILVSFDAGVPEDVTMEADGFTTYAGNFAHGNTENIFIVYQDTLLVRYNIEDDTYTAVASFSFENEGEFFTDFTTDYTTGELYGTTSADDGISRLYRVNRFTGEMELIGTYADYLLIAIAADDMGVLYGHDLQNDLIVTIDTETGELTEVGPTGINANYAQSMTFDQTTRQLLMAAYNIDNVYGERNELRFVDRSTGATTLIGKFYGDGSGEMGFFTTQGEGFLSVNLLSGTLPPGVSLNLDVKFDATNLYAGDYDAAISIVGEDLQGEPSVEIPAYLTVTGAPELTYSTDELTFDSVFVNGISEPQFVTIKNEGTDMLHVTSATLDSEDFIVYQYGFLSDTLLTLEPGEPVVLGFFFAPTSVGTLEGTFTLETDGGNYTLSLTGEGIPAPVLEMSTDSLAHQAYPNQQQSYSMTMSNTGGNPLEYSMVVGTMAETSSQSVMLLEEGFEGDFLPEGWSHYSQGDIGYPWQRTATRAHSGSYSAYHNDDFADCDDWLVTPQLSIAENSVLQFYDYTNYASWYEFSGVWISTGSPDPADGDYVLLDEIDDGSTVWTQRVVDLSDYAGSDVYIAFSYAGNFAHEWYIDDVTVSYELNWLSITSPTEGIMEPGTSNEMTLAVDATGLSGGVYQSGIIITTNDPLHPVEYIPFTLTVVEALTVSAIPDEEDEILHPNEEFTVPITVTSMDDLEVYSFQFTLNYDSELLNAVEIITEGTLSEGLALETNIGVPGAVSVAAAEVVEGTSNGEGLFSIEGEGPLMYVKFKAKEVLGDSSFSFSEVLFNEGTPGASSIGGNYSIEVLYGDANLDVNVSAFDATTILQDVVGLIELNEVATIAANVSGEGSVSAFDAALVLHYVAGLIDEFPVETASSAIAKTGKNVTADDFSDINSTNSSKKKKEKATISSVSKASVALSKATNNGEADMMNIPIELNDADKVYSISISLKYDEKLINVEDVRAKLPDSWVMVYNDDESFVNIAMAGTDPLPSGSLGAIVVEMKDPTEKANVTGEVTINESAASTIELNVQALPYKYDLSQNYPNPFNPTTTIKYQIPEQAKVSLVVYNQLGQVVKTLVDQEQDAGYYKVRWNGDNNFGSKVASGVYIFRMHTDSFVSVKKMVFLK